MPPKKHKKGSRVGNINPRGERQAYTGPLRIPGGRDQQDLKTIQMSVVTAVTSSGGVINTVVSNNPSGATDWSSATLLYDEYRVLSAEYLYMSAANMSYQGTVNPQVMVAVIDRDSGGALTSLSAGWNFASCIPVNTNKPFRMHARMNGSEDAQFVSTGSPAPTWYLKLYATSTAGAVNYGQVFTRLLVQFRGRN